MPTIPITLIQGDTVDKSKTDYRDALSVNMYAVPKQILGASGYMQQIHGLTQHGTTSGVSRGSLWVEHPDLEGHYRVQGTDFIRVNADGSVNVLGAVSGTGPVCMTSTFNNVIITNGSLYYYNPTDGFRQIVDNPTVGSVVGNPISCAYVSSVVVLTDGLRVYHSAFDEVGGVPAEEVFATNSETIPEFTSDRVFAVRQAENDEIVVLKEFSTEHFFLTGGANFAFQPANQKATRQGIVGSRAVSLLNGAWYTLGRRKETGLSCFAYSQGQSQKIASREIEQILNEYADEDLRSVTVDSFIYDDVEMVIYHLPNETLLFNSSIAKTAGKNLAWSILKTDVLSDATYRAKEFIYDPRVKRFVVGDKRDGKLGLFDDSVATHYGDIAEWIMYTPLNKLETVSINELEIETISGLNNPDNDATVFMSLTLDNGRTYGREVTTQYGMPYNYGQRFIRRAMGYVRDTVGFKFRGASKARMAFALLTIEVS